MNATTAQMSYILAGRQLGFILGNALGIIFILHKMVFVFVSDHRNLLSMTRAQPFLDTCSSLVLRLLNILLSGLSLIAV